MEDTVIGSSDPAEAPDIAQQFFELAGELVAVLDEDSAVQQINPACAEFTAMEPPDAIGQPLAALLRPTDPLSLSDLIARARLGESSPTNEIECNLGPYPRMLDATLHVLDGARLFVARDITERHRLAGELSARTTNSLASLANLSGLRDAVGLELKMSASVAVIHVSIVELAAIAAEHGESLTDELLQAAVSRIKRNLRDTDLVARTSAQSFAIMMAGDDVTTSAQRLGEQLVSSLSRTFGVKGQRIDAQCAIGIAVGSSDDQDTDSLLRAAEAASASAEVSGSTALTVGSRTGPRSRSVASGDDPTNGADPRADDDLDVSVGGIFRTDGSGALGIEVFMEPRQSAMERIAATSSGDRNLLEEIDLASLFTAAERAAVWLHGHSSRRLCVNIDHEQLKESGLFARFAAICSRLRLDPRSLVIEVPERTLSRLGGRAIEALRPIRQEGFELAIDRYGARGASLQLLELLPATYVKLDARFTEGLLGAPIARATVEAIHTVATAAGMEVIATGVATEQQFAELRTIGVPLVQGPFVHAVEPVQAFATKVTGS